MSTTQYLKPSRYNFIHESRNGNMMMCNFMRGKSSFMKFDKDLYQQVENYLDGTEIEKKEDSKIINILYKLGYLIDVDEDELMKIRARYYDVSFSNSLVLIILPTEQCNLRCKYCYEDYELGEMTDKVQESIVKYLQKNMKNYNSLFISWFGGEPLCALNAIKDITEKASAICTQRKKPYKYQMTTNAYGLSPDIFDSLYKLKVFEYQITLDGCKEQHDFQRVRADGAGTFDTIFENLKYIKSNIDKYPKVKIMIRVNVTKEIYEHFSDFLSLYKEHFSDDIHFEVLFKLAANWGGMENSEFVSHLITEKVLDIHEIISEFNIFEMDNIMLSNSESVFNPTSQVCYASRRNGFVIRPDGSVAKCTVHFKGKDQIGFLDEAGNMHVDQYLHSKWYLDWDVREMCQKCTYLPVCCGGGCTYAIRFSSQNNKCFNAELKKNLGSYLDYVGQFNTFYDLGKVMKDG